MIRRQLNIGRWEVDFLFAPDGYDREEVLSMLSDLGAARKDGKRIEVVIDNRELNTGFTFVSPYEPVILVAVGPASSGEQFVNTIAHELYHLATAIADGLGIDLRGEEPAYLIGDTIQPLVDIVCKLGCPHCNSDTAFVKK